jgi:hypothetical protein
MTNYVKFTNFTVKDSLPTGDTNKVIRGAEFDTEFDAIATAVATKSNSASPTFTGTATFDGITATGTVNFTGGSVTTNIDGGTIDGVTIGGSSAGAGTFSSLTATTGTFSGAVTGSNLNVSNWDTAYGWGDHGVEGYLTSVTFSDIDAGAVTLSTETFVNSDTQIPTNAAVRNWVLTTYPTIVELNDLTANVTWATVPDAYISESSVTQHEAALSISTSQLAGGLSLSDITDVTATASEVNTLDGITATTAELNYTDGVTSNIQTQLDSKVGTSHTGDVDITGELLVDSYNETFKKVSSAASTNYYDIANGSYDSKVVNILSLDGMVRDVFFKPDGTKMYFAGAGNDRVYQYSLSTAWDISTASYDSVYLSTLSGGVTLYQVTSLFFKSDGTKLFISDYLGDAIYQYTLTTAWDLSTASYDSVSLTVTSQDGNPNHLDFKPDGTKLYLLGTNNDTIFQYSMTTAWDLSTASYDSVSLDVTSTSGSSTTSAVFNNDGTKLFVLRAVDVIDQYSLTTAYDLTTASYDSVTFDVDSTVAGNAATIRFKDDGAKLYVIGLTNNTENKIYQFSTATTTYSTTFDCESANVFETVLDANTTVVFSNPPASGTPVVTGYQLGSAAYDSKSFSVSSQESSPSGITFNTNGTKMFIVGYGGDEVNEYDLTTSFDVSTSTYSQTFSVSAQATEPTGIAFNSDGTKMFILDISGLDVNEYVLTTGFDISTASYSQNFSVSAQEANPQGISFNTDGTKMFVVGLTGDDVNEYTLTTGFDVSTASYSQNFSVATQETSPTDVQFNADGTKMYIIGIVGDDVNEYTLTTGFDVSTASYTQNFSVASQETAPYGLAFSADGTKMFMVGSGSTVYQYSTSTSVLNDSTAYAMSLKVVQDSGASGYTVTWPTSVDWPSATAPTLTATASAVDQFVFYTYDGGTTWYGFTAGQALG